MAQWARKHGLVFKKDIQGEYILGQKLGEGASGVVYRAEPRQGGGTVAVKMLRKGTAVRSRAQYMELVSEIVALRRVCLLHGVNSCQETNSHTCWDLVAGQLDHPHIVRMVDVFNNQNAVHIVQEFMAGGELRNHILDVVRFASRECKGNKPAEYRAPLFGQGRYTEAVARGFISTLVDAVAHCHERNIIHRDIKVSVYTQAIDEGSFSHDLASQAENVLLTSGTSPSIKVQNGPLCLASCISVTLWCGTPACRLRLM